MAIRPEGITANIVSFIKHWWHTRREPMPWAPLTQCYGKILAHRGFVLQDMFSIPPLSEEVFLWACRDGRRFAIPLHAWNQFSALKKSEFIDELEGQRRQKKAVRADKRRQMIANYVEYEERTRRSKGSPLPAPSADSPVPNAYRYLPNVEMPLPNVSMEDLIKKAKP